MNAGQHRIVKVCGGSAAAIDDWPQRKSRRWAHTSFHRVSPTRTTVSTWVPGASFTMLPSLLTGTGGQWKRFLLQASLTDTRYGSDLQGLMPCDVRRSFAVRGRVLAKAAIAY